VVRSTSTKAAYRTAVASRHYTLVGTVSASGIACTPLVLSSRKTMNDAEGELASLAGLGWGGTAKGWMTGEALVGWVKNFFVPDVERIRKRVGNYPALLILDGHSSRKNLEAMSLLDDAGIHVFLLPPHSSHILQPLDDWVFLAFSNALRLSGRVREWSDWILRIQDAWRSSSSMLKIRSSFLNTGIWPLNPGAILGNPLLMRSPVSELGVVDTLRNPSTRFGIAGETFSPQQLERVVNERKSAINRKRRPPREENRHMSNRKVTSELQKGNKERYLNKRKKG